MQTDDVIEYFHNNYPDKTTVVLPRNNPTEIICEIDPTSLHPEYNRAIAAIKKSQPHYHRFSVETYKVIKGQLKLTIDGKTYTLEEGDEHVIEPNLIHFAEGDFTLVQVDSRPGWTPNDHILAGS